jgi:hypothetical protein
MKLTLIKNWGMLLLGIWLIVTGILELGGIPGLFLGLIAIAAGILILLGR